MLIHEYRIAMPMSVAEYQIAQLYTGAEYSKLQTGGKNGVEIIINEPFEDVSLMGGKYNSGQKTVKNYILTDKLPANIRALSSTGKCEVLSESYDAFPYCKTVLTNQTMPKDTFTITIETMVVAGKNTEENAVGLTEEQLGQRKVIDIDIVNIRTDPRDYLETADPSKVKSEKAGRGPLTGDWAEKADPVVTVYKVVAVQFKVFGLNNAEDLIQRNQIRFLTDYHRKMFGWMDSWYSLTLEEARKLDQDSKSELESLLHEGDVRGIIEK